MTLPVVSEPSSIQPPLINFCPRCGAVISQGFKFGKVRQFCPTCDYVHFVDPKTAAATFVEHDHKILLVKRGIDPQRGKWALPAGFVDYGEDPLQAAIRETAEETGLSVEVTRLIDVVFNKVTILIIYAARVIGGTLQAADDAEEAHWFGPHELPELAFRSTQTVVATWLKTQGE